MTHDVGDCESLRYVSNRAWWTPAPLVLLLVPSQIHANHVRWWPLLDSGLLVLLLGFLYVATHPVLTFSPHVITQRRGPFRTSIDLSHLTSVRVSTVGRRTSQLDPQTGARRSVIRFDVTSPDDWAGAPPVRAISVRDARGHHLTLGVLRTSTSRWGAYLLSSIRDDPDVEVGPRVVESLERFTR